MIRALTLAIAGVSLAVGASELERDAVERPLLLDAGQRQVALDLQQGMRWPYEEAGPPAANFLRIAPRIRVGLEGGIEAEVVSRSGICVDLETNACNSAFLDVGALLHVMLLDGAVQVAALSGPWGWHAAPVGTGGEPVLHSGLSLRAGFEGRVRPLRAISLRAVAAIDAAITGRTPAQSQAAPGYVEYNRDAFEAALELTWGPARWFSMAFDASWSAVVDPPLRLASNQQLPLALRLQFALPRGVDLGLGLGLYTVGPHRIGNLDHALYLSLRSAFAF